MKITESQLKQLVLESLQETMNEYHDSLGNTTYANQFWDQDDDWSYEQKRAAEQAAREADWARRQRGYVEEATNENKDNENKEDEGRVGNFFKSVGAGIKGLGNGMARQNYHDTMSNLSQADADAAESEAEKLRGQHNVGYSKIPAAEKIAYKYDAKINKLKQQISTLQAQKKKEMIAAKREYMSNNGKQIAKLNKQRDSYAQTATNAGNRAAELYNQRMTPPSSMQRGQQGGYFKSAANESRDARLDRIIKESINSVLMNK